MSKFILMAQRRLNKTWSMTIIGGIVLSVLIGGVLIAKADIGTITINDPVLVSGTTYKVTGMWSPQGNQCWTSGGDGTFHYKVYVFDDKNGNGNYDSGEKISQVNPAACNEDYTSSVSSSNRDLGGNWPAIASSSNGGTPQPDAAFTLGNGSHTICAALIHVQDNGHDRVDGVTCASKPIVIAYCGDGIKNNGEQCDGTDGVSPHQTCNADCHLVDVPYCGDGIVNQTSEQCDQGPDGGSTCTTKCTWKPATITLNKEVNNQFGGDAAPSDFTLKIDGEAVSQGVAHEVTLDTPHSIDEGSLTDTGYAFDSIKGGEQCPSELGGTVTLSAGENITCTITNHDVQPKLTVVKEVVGGPKTVADFPLFVGDISVTSGVQNGFNAGFYHVTETNQPGYTAAFSCNDDGEGTVSLNLGDVKTCTITNTYTPFCGDKIVDKREQCDGNTQVCTTADGYKGTQTCNMPPPPNSVTAAVATNYCTWNPCVTTEKCGDGIKNGLEQCDGTDGVASNQTCTAQCTLKDNPTPLTPNPVITLAKIDSPDPVAAGANITYTLNWTVSNASATNVVLTDVIPANTTFVSASTPSAYDSGTNKVTWSMGTVATGNYVTTLVVKVASPLANGTKIDNTATIDSTETDPVNAAAQTTVSTAPILSVEKIVDVTTANPGQTVNYTVKVTNSGTDTANNVKLTDVLPAGFTAKDDGTGTVIHSFGNIAAGETVSTSFAVVIGSTVTAGTYTNVVQVVGDNHSQVAAQIALNVVVPQVLGEKTEVTPAPKPKVLGATTLPVTGSNLWVWVIASMLVASLVGVGVYFKPRELSAEDKNTSK